MEMLFAGFHHQIDEYIENMEDALLGVGNGVPVSFDQEFADNYRVNSAGRMTLTAGVREFHAAPRVFDRAPSVSVVVKDHCDDVLRFSQGKTYDFSRSRDAPVATSLTVPTGVPHRYEPTLLRDLEVRFGHVTLINPALATLWRCEHLRHFSIYLTDRDPIYMDEINEVLMRWNPPRFVDFVSEVKGVAYLGSNGPRQNVVSPELIGNAEWVALTPNPYQISFPYDDYSLSRSGSRVTMVYSRKGRRVTVHMDDEPSFIRYNPQQVDRAYRSSGKDDHLRHGSKLRYFLETNSETLLLPMVEDQVGEPVGRLPIFPPFVLGVSMDATTVYDVQPLRGTYLSRRALIRRFAQAAGKRIVPLTTAGINVVTVNAISPFAGPFSSEFSSGDSHFVSCAGDFSRSDVPLENHGGDCLKYFGYIYSRSISVGVRATPFFEGAYIKVPFDPVSKQFHFNPAVPGLYFFFPSVSTMHAFQLPVLLRLYGSTFKPPICPYVPLDYETTDVSAYVHGVLDSLPAVDRVGEGGILIAELARLSSVSQLFLRDVLPHYTGVLMYSDIGGTRVCAVSRIRERFLLVSGIVGFSEIWSVWQEGKTVEFKTSEGVDRFREITNVVGRPLIRIELSPNGFVVKGAMVRNFSVRAPEFAPSPFKHYQSDFHAGVM